MNIRSILLRFILAAIVATLAFTSAAIAEEKDPICGKWKWISGAVHQFGPNGHIVGEKGCTWKRVETAKRQKYVVTWKTDYVDTLFLSPDGNRLTGKNTDGGEVWGERIK
jgi:uncharacterized protein (DUF2147 family)